LEPTPRFERPEFGFGHVLLFPYIFFSQSIYCTSSLWLPPAYCEKVVRPYLYLPPLDLFFDPSAPPDSSLRAGRGEVFASSAVPIYDHSFPFLFPPSVDFCSSSPRYFQSVLCANNPIMGNPRPTIVKRCLSLVLQSFSQAASSSFIPFPSSEPKHFGKSCL